MYQKKFAVKVMNIQTKELISLKIYSPPSSTFKAEAAHSIETWVRI